MVQGTEYGVESTEYQAGALPTLIVIMIQVRRELYAQCLDELIREASEKIITPKIEISIFFMVAGMLFFRQQFDVNLL